MSYHILTLNSRLLQLTLSALNCTSHINNKPILLSHSSLLLLFYFYCVFMLRETVGYVNLKLQTTIIRDFVVLISRTNHPQKWSIWAPILPLPLPLLFSFHMNLLHKILLKSLFNVSTIIPISPTQSPMFFTPKAILHTPLS